MIDAKDREIIEALRGNARLSYRELGETVQLSANAAAERVRRLQEDGVIKGYEASVDLKALDLPLQALIDVKMSPGVTAQTFEAVLHIIPGIVEACLTTGSFDYMLRVACRDQDALVTLTENLRARGGVQETYTRVVLRPVRLRNRLLG